MSPFLFSTLCFCAQISYAAGVSKPADFVGWVTDPARTNDELFTVELLLERMRVWQDWPFRERSLGFDEAQKVKKERRFNPAYRPFLALDELEALQERADTVTHFTGSGMSDRPLRDLTTLSFFHALENITSAASTWSISPPSARCRNSTGSP
ncbi:MAG: hypothetical protein H0X34_16735 [Chthoniobacterales bacterium]|nr:hypothetical protein [Chthoniobacterales bacterium]